VSFELLSADRFSSNSEAQTVKERPGDGFKEEDATFRTNTGGSRSWVRKQKPHRKLQHADQAFFFSRILVSIGEGVLIT
jgi:hypothetical protein